MKPEQWKKVKIILEEAVEIPIASRASFLEEKCGGDDDLRKEVESLLDFDDTKSDVLEHDALSAVISEGFGDQAKTFVGTQIGNYKIIGELGAGGMGAVFLAERSDGAFEQQVALKVIKRGMDSDAILRRFFNERQILASLKHPNIAHLIDGGTTDDGLPYFVLEYVEGETINEYATAEDLDLEERLRIFRKVGAAVSFAHSNLVIHRDLKPANILVTKDGNVKLLDFGIAKLLKSDADGATTATGNFVFTPEYASPEQIKGEKLTTASDVYSLGVILYELLTGNRPYKTDSKNIGDIIRAVCETPPERPSSVVSLPSAVDAKRTNPDEPETNPKSKIQNPKSLKGDLDNIILKALRKEPERRYSSVEQFSEDIRRHQMGLPVTASKDTFSYRGAKFIRRHKASVLTAALLLTTLLAGIIFSTLQRNRAEEQRARAEKGEYRNRQLLYAAQMNLAFQAWETNNVGRALDLLEAQQPFPGSEDFRGFEWHLLWRLTHERSQVLRGPTGHVASVAFSPDGAKLLAGSSDGTLRFWDAKTGRSVTSWDMNSCPVVDVALSPDGKYLAGSCKDGPGRLWDAENGQLIRTFEGHSADITSLDFSPDGRLLVTGSGDQTIKLWSMDAVNEEVATLRGHTKPVTSVAFSPDGKMLASGSHDSTVKLWDFESRKEIATLRGHTWWVSAVAFSPDGKTLATTGSDGDIKLWDLSARREMGTIEGDDVSAATLIFSPDGRMIAVAGNGTVVKIYEVATRKLYDLLRGHTDHIVSVAFSPDGKTLASAGFDFTVRIWDLTKQPGALTLDGHKDWVWSLDFSPDGRTLATSSKDATVKLWEIPEGRELMTISHPKWVNDVAFSPDGSKLATASDDKLVRLWDAADGRSIFSTNEHNGVAECVTFSPDGKFMASGSVKQEIKIWDTTTGKEVETLHSQNPNIIWSLAFSPDGKYLASGEGGKREGAATGAEVTLWDFSSRQILATLQGHSLDVRAVAFSPDGSILASGSEGGTIKIWDVGTRQEIITLKSGKIASLAFSPDGKRLVSGGLDKMIKLWDVSTWQELCTLNVPSEITSVGFSPDGRVLAVASKDNKVRLWSARTED